jgi:hypothetical protein
MEIAGHMDQMVLLSGYGDFSSAGQGLCNTAVFLGL